MVRATSQIMIHVGVNISSNFVFVNTSMLFSKMTAAPQTKYLF